MAGCFKPPCLAGNIPSAGGGLPAGYLRNAAYAKKLFIDEACLFGFLEGELEHGSIQQFYKNVDTVGSDKNFKARVDVIDVEETLAVVRVLEEGWGGRIDFTDYLLLMKFNGEWKCVAKAYNQNSNTIQKK